MKTLEQREAQATFKKLLGVVFGSVVFLFILGYGFGILVLRPGLAKVGHAILGGK
jgi:hypothetical protein